MSDTLLAAVVGAIAGIITGSIGSLVAPWANWGIEKRKQKLAYRRELIEKWRTMLHEIQSSKNKESKLGKLLTAHPHWPSFKPYLSEHAKDTVETYWSSYVKDVNGDVVNSEVFLTLIDDIGNIEKKWKLS